MSRSKRKKKQENRKNAANLLSKWQEERLLRDRDFPLPPQGPSEITVVTYFAPGQTDRAEAFARTECALMETWRNCGFMQTVVVADAPTPALDAFASQFGRWVEIQIEPGIRSGAPRDVAANRAATLPERFLTSSVLVVSPDAFPVRPGIGWFVDKFDFVGAPHPLAEYWLSRAAASLFGIHAMDGAFSLRSRALCLRVAAAWRAKYAGKPVPESFSDGLFATSVLPSRSLSFRRQMRLPSFSDAQRFSTTGSGAPAVKSCPFGFSGAQAFLALSRAGLA